MAQKCVVETCWRRVLYRCLQKAVVSEDCCKEVLEKSVVEALECCREVMKAPRKRVL